MYSYKNSKSNIINILKSKTPIIRTDKIPQDVSFTYENGIITKVASIFVDIEDSTELFKNKDFKTAQLMRAFTSEVICIFQDLKLFNQIGIRGDCVYVIYDVSQKEDLVSVFRIAYKLNTFLKMFNNIIKLYGYTEINAGIGIGYDESLIIKAGRTGTGINDKIWIGRAVVDASNLSSIAGRNNIERIAMSSSFYKNVIDLLINENYSYISWIKKYYDYSNNEFYHCNIVEVDFNNWIDGGMK